MIRYFTILFIILTSFLLSFSANQGVKIDITVPSEIKAGDEFLITINITKGSLDGLSRFQQNLPYGLTATRISTANADFTFEDQRVRFIWLKLPAEPVISVAYRVKVDDRLKGSFSLGGRFSYLTGNKRESVDATIPNRINIIPNPNLAENQLIDIDDFEGFILAEIKSKNEIPRLDCFRRPPVQVSPREIIVELFINKGKIDNMARIEEYIPAGFMASEIDSKNGIFSFENQTVKINWLKLPDEQYFTVKYRLFPERGKTINDLKLSGSYSYLYGNEVKTVEIIEKIPDLALLNTAHSGDNTYRQVDNDQNNLAGEAEIKISEKPVRVKNRFEQQITPTGSEFWILQAERDIYYRIQLAAGKRPVNITNYFKRLPYMTYVRMEFHEGWFKYSVGSFYDYEEAKDYLADIMEKSEFIDAFIVAYNNGKRITVQEALGINDLEEVE